MLGLILAALAAQNPVPPSPGRMAVLADAGGFGMCHEVVRANWQTAVRHRWTMGERFANELPAQWFQLWVEQQEWRRDCWMWLEIATDETNTDATRLAALDRLLDELGTEDYLDRRMPMPIPSYRR